MKSPTVPLSWSMVMVLTVLVGATVSSAKLMAALAALSLPATSVMRALKALAGPSEPRLAWVTAKLT